MASNTVPNARNASNQVRVILHRTERNCADDIGVDAFIDGKRLRVQFDAEQSIPLSVAQGLQSAGFGLKGLSDAHLVQGESAHRSVVISTARELRTTKTMPAGCVLGGAFASSF